MFLLTMLTHQRHLQEAVLSLKQEYKNNLTLVFGCGGERDKKKIFNGKNR